MPSGWTITEQGTKSFSFWETIRTTMTCHAHTFVRPTLAGIFDTHKAKKDTMTLTLMRTRWKDQRSLRLAKIADLIERHSPVTPLVKGHKPTKWWVERKRWSKTCLNLSMYVGEFRQTHFIALGLMLSLCQLYFYLSPRNVWQKARFILLKAELPYQCFLCGTRLLILFHRIIFDTIIFFGDYIDVINIADLY